MDGIGRKGISNLTLLIRQETYTLKDSHSCIQPERSICRGKKALVQYASFALYIHEKRMLGPLYCSEADGIPQANTWTFVLK